MRRKEFKIEEKMLIDALLLEAEYLHLGCIGLDGFPYVTAVNFMAWEEKIYLHSSPRGKKIESIQKNENVFLSLAEPFALIPSWATSAELACGATQFFQSIHIQGTAKLVEDLGLKANVMGAMMKKLQPEGGHLDLGDPKHRNSLKAMALIEIEPLSVSAKFKFGQNLNEEKRASVVQALEQSSDPRALSTLSWMQAVKLE